MPLISKESIDAVKNRIPLEDVVGRLVQLKRSGRNWRGLSPFTQEKTPSFFVLPDKNIFKCFSSGLAGDVIRFVQETEKLEFTEAVETLAERYNITLTYQDGSLPQGPKPTLKREILEIHEYACDYFHRQLLADSEDGRFIRAYWKEERGFSAETAKSYRIGWAPADSKGLANMLRRKGFSSDAIRGAGIFYEPRHRQGDPLAERCRFRGRLMIPIRNVQGQVIAFTARQTARTPADDPAREAKYVNSPETAVFTKGRMMFHLDKASRTAVEKDHFLLVEGQLDAIRCAEAGYPHTVAPQGTGITEEQLGLLARYTHHLTIILDGDRAGQDAALRILPLALRAGLEVGFVSLPEGSDPDSLLRGGDTAGWERHLASRATAMEFAVPALLGRHPDTATGRREAFEELFRFLMASESSLVQSQYLAEAIVLSGADERAVLQDFQAFREHRSHTAARRTSTEDDDKKSNQPLTSLERCLLWIVLQDVDWAQRLAHVIEHEWVDTRTIEGRVLSQVLAEARNDAWEGVHHADALFDDQAERDCLYAVYAEELSLENSVDEYLRQVVSRHLSRQVETISRQLRQTECTREQQRELFQKQVQITRQRMELNRNPPRVELPPRQPGPGALPAPESNSNP